MLIAINIKFINPDKHFSQGHRQGVIKSQECNNLVYNLENFSGGDRFRFLIITLHWMDIILKSCQYVLPKNTVKV